MPYVLIGFCLIQTVLMAQRMTYQDTFEGELDTTAWCVRSGSKQRIAPENGRLLMDVSDAATVWFRKKLAGNWTVEFDRAVLVEGKPNDRLADVNFFWQAGNPHDAAFTERSSANDDSLSLYYAQIGGNRNTTTQFLKYHGDGERALLLEYTDASHLLTANKLYHFQITMQNKVTQVYVNDRLFFSFTDDEPLTNGYFGFNTTKSRQVIDNFKVVSFN
ncbi:DUF6250 domain-containing protein [Runella sp.]|uniref:DUF6250 domain-containing protein n=1 Tax=Runella sp. TaxID=1960881 RepID=UPI003D0A5C88